MTKLMLSKIIRNSLRLNMQLKLSILQSFNTSTTFSLINYLAQDSPLRKYSIDLEFYTTSYQKSYKNDTAFFECYFFLCNILMREEFYQHLTLSRIIRLLFNMPLNHKIYFTLWKVNEINEFF
jgi:hypothetical protein